jgi:hypothetical protein
VAWLCLLWHSKTLGGDAILLPKKLVLSICTCIVYMINIRAKVDAFRSTELSVFMKRWKELVSRFNVFPFYNTLWFCLFFHYFFPTSPVL